MTVLDEELFEYWRVKYDRRRVDIAITIYDEVLVPICGAYADEAQAENLTRQQFVQWFAMGSRAHEFRFQGLFGFGGKFWDSDDKWRVSFYPEDRTDEREHTQTRANAILALMHQGF